jgi:hypothetical protein
VTPAATPTPSASQTAGNGACSYAELSFTVGQSSGAAGTAFTPMVFTNKSAATCTLQGYPTVTLLDSTGGQMGSPATHDTSKAAALVTLAPSASASASVATHNPGAYPSGACSGQSAQVKVVVPGQSQAFMAPFTAFICGSWTVAPIVSGSM